jgi:trimeric autotransporter adhesin
MKDFLDSLKQEATSIRIYLMKNRDITFSLCVFICLGLAQFAPKAFGVVPAPEGGYPGGNTAEGHLALLSRSTGLYNTAVGVFSLLSLTDGNFCTGVGAGALLSNTADGNTATGAGALFSNSTGANNTANGEFALFKNTGAQGNTAIGTEALFSNTTGPFNTATGFGALANNTDAVGNTANGALALSQNTTGIQNTAIGAQALQSNQVGNHNTATGFHALLFNTASGNTAYGYQALSSNTTGIGNTANGFQALFSNTDGNSNTATGDGALADSTGSDNTAVGQFALNNNTTGSLNTALGAGAGVGVTTANNVICIGAAGDDVDNSCYISNIWNQSSPGGMAVFVNSDGKLGTTVSSRKFKEDIRPMDRTSEAILALQPVTFRYKKQFDPTGISQFGLVAEQVEKVNPDLVVHDQEGRPYSVRYDQVNAMLLNEFLKAHKKIEEQQATIAQVKKEMETVFTRLKDQDAKIQRVSDQVGTGRGAPRWSAFRNSNTGGRLLRALPLPSLEWAFQLHPTVT